MARRPELQTADETSARLDQFAQLVRAAEMTGPSRKGVLAAIATMKGQLDQLERDVDPVRLPDAFFDPAEPRLIGHFVALALISQDRVRLDAIQPMYGAGVYAIYYTGPEDIRKKNEADHLARTIEALALCDEHDEQLACLKRMGWLLDDAIKAGLIEVATPVQADVDQTQEQDAVTAGDLVELRGASLEQVAKRANDLPDVRSARIWKGKRVYIDLYAKDHTFRGDRNHQLYYCADRGLVSQHGSGITSSNFDEAVEKFLANFAA
ncbi:hypothetical protein Q4543_23845 [Salipiger sp. 1_MG-2023]|uniref:hypothetical protein n=1 Tax=Salipiger sp. 1_MG-2023 TaxID=3062665 RepID=UPI0026E342BF|nr:hypothetical protein [Salipiger sp. 1_MG-2023]MDO6588512.1 hypothetical protein [Salipiger sp. 1_MG-2023]